MSLSFDPPHFNWFSVMDSECGGSSMTNKRPKPEEIVSKLRQVEVLMGQGMTRLDAIRQIGVVEQTYYRLRKQYGRMGVDQLISKTFLVQSILI
jgi:putative transposase